MNWHDACLMIWRQQALQAGWICMQCRTVSGTHFLWLVLQHVLPKGWRRARNFGFLHPNCKRLIALVHLLLKFVPVPLALKPRPHMVCPCCGAVMMVVKTRIRPSDQTRMPEPVMAAGVH